MGKDKIKLIVHLLMSLPCWTIARIPSARVPPSPLRLLTRSSPLASDRHHRHLPEQEVDKRDPHNGVRTILHPEGAVVDRLPHNLAPLPLQAGEDAAGVYPAPNAATTLFGYGAAIATPGGSGGPGQGLDMHTCILGLGLT
jgi:hypothetical protein